MNRALQARRVHFVQTLFCRVLESRNILSNEGSFKRFLSEWVWAPQVWAPQMWFPGGTLIKARIKTAKVREAAKLAF